MGLLVLFILSSLDLYGGEVNRYIIYLSDKAGSGYTIDRPEEFLTARAIERRAKQNIDISEQDLPVSQQYIDLLTQQGIDVFITSKWMNCLLAEFDSEMLAEVEGHVFVKNVELAAPGSKLSTPSTGGRKSGKKEYLSEVEESLATDFQNEMMGVDQMHERGFRGEGMLIGVFDSGFTDVDSSSYFKHVFDEGRIIGTRDFVRRSGNVFQYDEHGSKVLSCIGAYRDDSYRGTAYQSDFVLCVTEDVSTEYRIEEFNWLAAAEYADSLGVDIINSSVGYSYFDDDRMDYTYEDLDGNTALITRAVDLAASRGIIVVGSNGNEGNTSWKYLNAPADADSMLAIGAINPDLSKASFSSFGPSSDGRIKPEVSALGAFTKVVRKEEISSSNGTSFSSPLVTGLAAGFWQAYPHLTNMEVIQYLKITASQSQTPDTLLGYGIPNFVRAANKVNTNEGDLMSTFVIFPNPVDQTRKIYIYADSFFTPGPSIINFYDLKGSMLRSENILVDEESLPLELDISFLRPGTYIITCESNKQIKKSKLVVM